MVCTYIKFTISLQNHQHIGSLSAGFVNYRVTDRQTDKMDAMELLDIERFTHE